MSRISSEDFRLIFALCDPGPTAIPSGYEISGWRDAEAVSWFGVPLDFEDSGVSSVLIAVGVDNDAWPKVRVCDFDVFGFNFVKKCAPPLTPESET